MNRLSLTKTWRRILMPLFFAAFIILTVAAPAAAQKNGYNVNRELELWRTFKPENGKFSISLPGVPESVPAAFDFQGTEMEIYRLDTSTSSYLMFYISRKPNAEEEEIFKLVFKNFPAAIEKINSQMIEKNVGHLVSQKNLSTPKMLKYEVVTEVGASSYKTRYFFSNNTFYGVQVITPVLHNIPEQIAAVYQAEADKFFNSFQIVNNKTQTARKAK